jgi:hypothetical protein
LPHLLQVWPERASASVARSAAVWFLFFSAKPKTSGWWENERPGARTRHPDPRLVSRGDSTAGASSSQTKRATVRLT